MLSLSMGATWETVPTWMALEVKEPGDGAGDAGEDDHREGFRRDGVQARPQAQRGAEGEEEERHHHRADGGGEVGVHLLHADFPEDGDEGGGEGGEERVDQPEGEAHGGMIQRGRVVGWWGS